MSVSLEGWIFMVGLRVFDVEEIPTHGGSLRVFAQRGIRFAHPARTLWFRQNGAPIAPAPPPIATPDT